MKQRTLLIACIITLLFLSGCKEEPAAEPQFASVKTEVEESTQNEQQEFQDSDPVSETPESVEYIDGFEKAEYEKFNSYASDNGLGGTAVYIEGKVLNQTKIGDSAPPVLAFVVEQEDGKRWCVSISSDSEIEGLEGKNVRIFGTYQGFSDVMNLPAIAVATENFDLFDKVRMDVKENEKYNTVWSFLDYLNAELEGQENEGIADESKNTLEETFGNDSETIPETVIETEKPTEAEAPEPVSESVWVSKTGSKYHRIPDCGKMNPDTARKLSRDDAIAQGYEACKKCY